MRRLYRIPRRLFRKATKPARLWVNAWFYKQSEEEIQYLASVRCELAAKEYRQRVRQMRLQRQRNKIAGW